MSKCMLCPRECGADRERGEIGFCGAGSEIKTARCAPHFWEEPPISGERGSGTIFFSGCPLKCVFCQNKEISHGGLGKKINDTELEKMILELAEKGVHNINFVTPTHYTDKIAKILKKIKPSLKIPIVWNCGGYEKEETLDLLDGLVDIYLPDFKYFDSELAFSYSAAPDYRDVAVRALKKMFSQAGEVKLSNDGMMERGMIVRHLVLPGCRKDSIAVLELIADTLPADKIYLSLMSQYTPEFALDSNYKNLHRRVTSFEYNSVAQRAKDLGFIGFMQERSSSVSDFTPDFSGE